MCNSAAAQQCGARCSQCTACIGASAMMKPARMKCMSCAQYVIYASCGQSRPNHPSNPATTKPYDHNNACEGLPQQRCQTMTSAPNNCHWDTHTPGNEHCFQYQAGTSSAKPAGADAGSVMASL